MSTAPKLPFPGLESGIPPKRTAHGAVILDRPATIADLNQLPPTWRGEVIEGTLYAIVPDDREEPSPPPPSTSL